MKEQAKTEPIRYIPPKPQKEDDGPMHSTNFEILEQKVIIRIKNRLCETEEELLSSEPFRQIVINCINKLSKRDSILLSIFGSQEINIHAINTLIETFKYLIKLEAHYIPRIVEGSDVLLKDRMMLHEFVEYLYNYWRSYDRFIVCDSIVRDYDKRPYRTFNDTIEQLSHLVRKIYRDIQENLAYTHPKVYRQVRAGAEVACISVPKTIPFKSKTYHKLNAVTIVRQILLNPPLILNPPMNKRKGRFQRVDTNPLEQVTLNPQDWICYPAKVGPILVFIYIHKCFYELGFSLCNLFDLADDDDLLKKPDAVFVFGVQNGEIDNFGEMPTIFYEDNEENLLVGAVPGRPEYGYFGYLKKMVLTLHNVAMMKSGKFPFHGALVRILLKNNKEATVLFIGDSGAGKSETLQALETIARSRIRDMIVIADDMGSINLNSDGQAIGYGTEIGAFLRLDDLHPGYAFGQIDRAIIMSANKVNARITLPVTTFSNVMKGHKIDYLLYANNYEKIDDSHPPIEQLHSAEDALAIFREGKVMSKGTTNTTGIVNSYFANIFGPPEYKERHDELADTFFKAMIKNNIFIGQMRTQLGIPGFEQNGPEVSAEALLKLISDSV